MLVTGHQDIVIKYFTISTEECLVAISAYFLFLVSFFGDMKSESSLPMRVVMLVVVRFLPSLAKCSVVLDFFTIEGFRLVSSSIQSSRSGLAGTITTSRFVLLLWVLGRDADSLRINESGVMTITSRRVPRGGRGGAFGRSSM